MIRALVAFAAVWSVSTVLAVDTEQAFDDPGLNARYHTLIREVRCVTCLNQTIADSSAPLAADLRREIHEMIANGSSDAEIVDFLVSRYGDFIMYRPPVKPLTWALWGGPVALLVVGGIVFLTIVRARGKQPLEDEDELA